MKRVILVVIAIAIVAAVLSGCGTKVPGVPNTVATVNGESISAAEYLGGLNRQAGPQPLSNMIEQKIIVEWAKDAGVPVTDEQVAKQIDILKREGSYDDQVKSMTEEGVKTELIPMVARMNLGKKFYKFPQKDIDGFYEALKSRYNHGVRKQAAVIVNFDEKKIKEAEKSIKGGMDFDEAASAYTVSQFASRGTIKIWIDENQAAKIPPSLMEAIRKTKVGEVSKMFKITQPSSPAQYAILKIIQEQPKQEMSKKDVTPELIDFAAMQKTQSDPDFQKKLNAQKKKANITVDIEPYKSIVQTFKNPPPPSPMMQSMPQPAPQPGR